MTENKALEKSNQWFNLWIPETHRNIARFDPKPSQLPHVENIKIWAGRPYSVLLSGIAGCGKTHLMLVMLKCAILKNTKAFWPQYYKSSDLDAKLLAALHSDHGDRLFIHRLRTCDLLCIDDLGTETRDQKTGRASDRVIRQYYDILDHRIDANLPTLISSNLDVPQLGDFFNDPNKMNRIGSRMQLFEQWEIEGPDLRQSV